MPFNTLTVGAAVAPSVIETYFFHFLHRWSLRKKPTAHISYHEGLELIRHFLEYASQHTVEDLQGFTAQHVPTPHWVRIEDVEIAATHLQSAAELLHKHLGPDGLEAIGGKTWWQWRRPDTSLQAEWIEMKKDYNARKRAGSKCERVIFYVHGGGYFFGSVDEHRYQMQRHARKLQAQIFAPRYRLAPQFPFPCGLQDCIATYLYLLEHCDPSHIIFAGDSAGGGMLLSLLCILRDQKKPLPAGTILLSPWVDLTHSFPSLAGDSSLDYIPPWGFLQRPSMAWPPASREPNVDMDDSNVAYNAAVELPASAELDMKSNRERAPESDDDFLTQYRDTLDAPRVCAQGSTSATPPQPRPVRNLTVQLDGETVEIREQIQMYAPNELLAHPLVSPVMQPTLGGLPPMLIQTGGGELLRDEQIYIAHRAAAPERYPARDSIYEKFDPERKTLQEYPPTNVQLQVWEDLCHVAHTLSFTRPAKYMYRSVAQFGAWALAHAQNRDIDMQNDETMSVISRGSDECQKDDGDQSIDDKGRRNSPSAGPVKVASVGKAGDPLPPFEDHMIRQRVTRHGVIYPLPDEKDIPCLSLERSRIGTVQPEVLRIWLKKKRSHDAKFAKDWQKVQARRRAEITVGYEEIAGECPPPTALVGRRSTGMVSEEWKKGKSWGLAMWSGWGSSHDEHTLAREKMSTKYATQSLNTNGTNPERANGDNQQNLSLPNGDERGRQERRASSASRLTQRLLRRPMASLSKSPSSQKVSDQRQTNSESPTNSEGMLSRDKSATPTDVEEPATTTGDGLLEEDRNLPIPNQSDHTTAPSIPTMTAVSPDSEKLADTEYTFLSPTSSRPHNGTVAYPFKLRSQTRNSSNVTLDSAAGLDVSATPSVSEVS